MFEEFLLKNYLRLHHRFHRKIISRLSKKVFDGIHPKNIFNYRSLFFVENVSQNDTVIDLGCGTGYLLKAISPKIKKGIGLDRSDKNLLLCREHFQAENLDYQQGDILDLDYDALKRSTHYNTIILSHILEHIEDSVGFLKRIKAPKLLICVPSQENWYSQLLRHFKLPYFKDETHFREYTISMLQNELDKAGYKISFIGNNPEGEIIASAQLASEG